MREWFRAATSPRLLGIFALLLVGAIVCVRLGAWQIDRAIGQAEQQAAIDQAAREQAAPVPIADVVAPQTSFTQAMVGSRVELIGSWEPELAYWVPERDLDGVSGYLLLTAFREDATGALMPVVRGWVPERSHDHLTLPAGTVTIMGYLAGSEGGETGPQPGSDIDSVNAGALVNAWGAPIYSGQLLLISAQPDGGAPGSGPAGSDQVLALPPPALPQAGLNLRNIAYAAEWFVFGGFALMLWWRMVRDEVRQRRDENKQPDPQVTA
ncbi:MAG: SURF1 family protein [Beutenbergiaceae bacterium]